MKSAPDPRPLFDAALAEGSVEEWFTPGDYDAAVRGSRPLAATYYAAPSQHLGHRASFRDGEDHRRECRDLGAGAGAGLRRRTEGDAFPMPPGEPAGRAMEPDAAPIAIALAKAVGRPVQVTLSQSASQNSDTLSPGALARLTALPGVGGITSAWAMKGGHGGRARLVAGAAGWQDRRPNSAGRPRWIGAALFDSQHHASTPFRSGCRCAPATCVGRRNANSPSSPRVHRRTARAAGSNRCRSGWRCWAATGGLRVPAVGARA